ncbi:MAG: hypothetical protein ACJ757_02440 [Gaiellaceae bacterium]
MQCRGVGLGLFVAYGLSSAAMGEIFGGHTAAGYQQRLNLPPLALIVLYGVGALFAYAGSVAAVAGVLRWAGDPAASRTVRLLSVLLPAGVAVAIGATVAFASMRGYSTGSRTVFAEVLVASAVFAVFVGGIRVRAIRQQRRDPFPAQPPIGAW